MASYLLPCPCGQKIPVQSRQAGQMVACRCGGSLEVPTLAGLSRLERVDAAAEHKAAKPWGARQQMTLLGIVVAAAGAVLTLCIVLNRPIAIPPEATPEQIRSYVDRLSPTGSWQVWLDMRSAGLDPRRPRPDPRYEENVLRYRLWLGVAIAVAACGGTLVVAAQFIRPPAVRVATRAGAASSSPRVRQS